MRHFTIARVPSTSICSNGELVRLASRDLLEESAAVINRLAIGTQEGKLWCQNASEEIAVARILCFVEAGVERAQGLVFCHLPLLFWEFRPISLIA
jgi:hypothetical protein